MMTDETISPGPNEEASPPSEDVAPHLPQPSTIKETGIEFSLLVDLTLKTIHFAGRPSARQLAEQLALSFAVTEELVTFLRQEEAIEIVGSAGVGEQAYQYALTERGRSKANAALARSEYVGPAPVPFQLYTEVIRHQSVENITIDRETFLNKLSHLVLDRSVLSTLGPAVNSGHSMLIYGAAGNGKSSIAKAIGAMLPGEVLIPHAVEIHGQIIRIFDPRLHHQITPEVAPERRAEDPSSPPISGERRKDRRWVLAKRPVVSVGGELTLPDLELRYSPVTRFYIAPLQWKANSGMFIIDDFGRQMIQPQELLNRWIVPMEQGVDHLSLQSGDTVEVPFDTLLVFSSNLPPGRLGDEAFFRRIRHKVEVLNPSPEDFMEILRRACEQVGVTYTEEGAQHLVRVHYEQAGREMRACHPRDLLGLILDISSFYGEEPSLSADVLDLACASYFVDLEEAA